MPGEIARSLRVTAQRSGQGSKTAAEAASAAQMRADLDGENGVARWVQQQASPPSLFRYPAVAGRIQEAWDSRRRNDSGGAHQPGALSTGSLSDFVVSASTFAAMRDSIETRGATTRMTQPSQTTSWSSDA